jgi:hypothetical protein
MHRSHANRACQIRHFKSDGIVQDSALRPQNLGSRRYVCLACRRESQSWVPKCIRHYVRHIQSSPEITSWVVPRPATLFERTQIEANFSTNAILKREGQFQTIYFDEGKNVFIRMKIYKNLETTNYTLSRGHFFLNCMPVTWITFNAQQ